MAKAKKSKYSKLVQVCPKCFSREIGTDNEDPAAMATGLFNSRCYNCDFVGMMFPEVPENEVPKDVKVPKTVGKREMVSTTVGRGELGLWKLFGPTFIILGLIGMVFMSNFRDGSAVILILGLLYTSVGYYKSLRKKIKS